MKPYKSVRRELILASLLLTIFTCILFSIGIIFVVDEADDLLFDAHIASDVKTFVRQYTADARILQIPHDSFSIFLVKNGDKSGLPDAVAKLAPGEDDLLIDGHEYDVRVENIGDEQLYFVTDEGVFEDFEQFLLIALILIDGLVILLALGFTWHLANRILTPLNDLARSLFTLDETYESPLAFAGNTNTENEITVVVSAINQYHERIREVLTREREFSADVSHELRTPLMSIHGAAELISRNSNDGPNLDELVARIKRGCTQMTGLTEALLFLARDPKSFHDMMEPISIGQVIDSQVTAIQVMSSQKGITVNVNRGGDPSVLAIPAVINIVIGNILKNAVKYTNKNLINIFLEDREIVIQDYGPGIDADLQPRLFNRFERGSTDDEVGVGIGLALVSRFCEQYGWSLDFRSRKDEGTRVSLSFDVLTA